jgi:hypothetical protein
VVSPVIATSSTLKPEQGILVGAWNETFRCIVYWFSTVLPGVLRSAEARTQCSGFGGSRAKVAFFKRRAPEIFDITGDRDAIAPSVLQRTVSAFK